MSEYSIGKTVPSFTVNEVKYCHGSVGDTGIRIETYSAVVSGSIVNIRLNHVGYVGLPESSPSTIDGEKVFDELDKAIKGSETVTKK